MSVRFTRLEDRVVRLMHFEEKILKMTQLEERVNGLNAAMAKLSEDLLDKEATQRGVIGRVELLEARPIPSVAKRDLDTLRDELTKRSEQLRAQVQSALNHSLGYIQQFTDQRAIDKIAKMQSSNADYTSKLNSLEWLLRNRNYLNDKASLEMVETFKEAMGSSSTEGNTSFLKHSSDIMSQLVKSIREIKKPNSEEEQAQALSDATIVLSILEASLVNEQNVDSGLSLGLMEDLIGCIGVLLSSYQFKAARNEVKLAVRCLTYCFQNPRAPDLLINSANGLPTLLSLIDSYLDEELVANSLKILRNCLKDNAQYDKILQKVPALLGALLRTVKKSESDIVLEEAMAALRSCTRKQYALSLIDDLGLLESLCEIAGRKAPSRARDYCLDVLANCCKSAKLTAYIKDAGVYDMIPKFEDRIEFC
eukprot:TRINITY_DN9492_c0_g4_i2.p1 TRINITY_DN9492_c0_g4~~TRINITY_DN9492_c0_g4_i2.p1  ORF type:complete len:423 (+),score=53.00 TRINITY_DN9492_c0_g4_i2:156-1424(+)